MSLDVALLRSSFDLVVAREPHVTARFYEILFSRHPQARSLFGGRSDAVQAEMLRQALVAVLEHLEDSAWLVETLGALGQKHAEYGVTREMYDWVGASLLAALAEVAGDQWTPELESAWREAYGAIASLMQSGASAAARSASG